MLIVGLRVAVVVVVIVVVVAVVVLVVIASSLDLVVVIRECIYSSSSLPVLQHVKSRTVCVVYS